MQARYNNKERARWFGIAILVVLLGPWGGVAVAAPTPDRPDQVVPAGPSGPFNIQQTSGIAASPKNSASLGSVAVNSATFRYGVEAIEALHGHVEKVSKWQPYYEVLRGPGLFTLPNAQQNGADSPLSITYLPSDRSSVPVSSLLGAMIAAAEFEILYEKGGTDALVSLRFSRTDSLASELLSVNEKILAELITGIKRRGLKHSEVFDPWLGVTPIPDFVRMKVREAGDALIADVAKLSPPSDLAPLRENILTAIVARPGATDAGIVSLLLSSPSLGNGYATISPAAMERAVTEVRRSSIHNPRNGNKIFSLFASLQALPSAEVVPKQGDEGAPFSIEEGWRERMTTPGAVMLFVSSSRNVIPNIGPRRQMITPEEEGDLWRTFEVEAVGGGKLSATQFQRVNNSSESVRADLDAMFTRQMAMRPISDRSVFEGELHALPPHMLIQLGPDLFTHIWIDTEAGSFLEGDVRFSLRRGNLDVLAFTQTQEISHPRANGVGKSLLDAFRRSLIAANTLNLLTVNERSRGLFRLIESLRSTSLDPAGKWLVDLKIRRLYRALNRAWEIYGRGPKDMAREGSDLALLDLGLKAAMEKLDAAAGVEWNAVKLVQRSTFENLAVTITRSLLGRLKASLPSESSDPSNPAIALGEANVDIAEWYHEELVNQANDLVGPALSHEFLHALNILHLASETEIFQSILDGADSPTDHYKTSLYLMRYAEARLLTTTIRELTEVASRSWVIEMADQALMARSIPRALKGREISLWYTPYLDAEMSSVMEMIRNRDFEGLERWKSVRFAERVEER